MKPGRLLICTVIVFLVACDGDQEAALSDPFDHPPQAKMLTWDEFASKPDWIPEPESVQQLLNPDAASPKRDLARGESHGYRVHIPAGYYVAFEVVQHQLDVSIWATDHRAMDLLVDSPIGRTGSEYFSYLANDGEQVLSMRVRAGGGKGGYQIRMSDWRPIRQGDAERTRHQHMTLRGFTQSISRKEQERQQAIKLFDQVIPYYRENRNYQKLTQIYLMRAGILRDTHNTEDAIPDYKLAAEYARQSGSILEMSAINNLGVLYYYDSQFNQALDVWYRALHMARKMEDTRREAKYLNNIAMAYLDLGEYQLAYEYSHQALDISTDIQVMSEAYNNIGAIYDRFGKPEAMLEGQHKMLELFRSQNNTAGIAFMTSNLANIYLKIDRRAEAFEMVQEALDLARKHKGLSDKHMIYHTAATYYLDENNYVQGLRYLQLATQQARSNGYSFLGLGQAQFNKFFDQSSAPSLELLREAAGNLQTAQRWSDFAKDPRLKSNALLLLASIHNVLGDLDPIPLLREALDIIEGMRGGVSNTENRNAFFATKQMYYDLYINLLMERGEAKELDQNRRRALHAAEKASARHLVEVLHSGSMTEPGRSGTELVEVLWEARHEREDLLSEIGPEDPDAEQQTRLRELDRRILMLNRQFQGDRQTQTNLAESAILKADAIQQLADPGSLILVYHLGDKKSHLWAVSQDDIRVYSLPGRVELLPLITQAHELLRESESGDAKVISQRDKALSELSNQLIAPVLKDGNYQRLGIVANGPLQLIPFAALPIEPDVRLLERYELVYLPSASVLGALREQLKDRELAPKLLLAFADPVFDSGPSLNRSPGGELGEQSSWVRLPKTLEEAQSIKRIATRLGQDDNVSILTGYQATRKAVLSNRSSEYRILHFATHGLADARDPNQSSLVFSLLDKDGRAVDGYLRLNEISHLKLNADLIVLSACRTAFGKEVRGEGLISLARGFMFAGAPRVVATLWQVNDVSTSRLMEYFYVEMLEKNQRPAAALREAQLKIMREYDLDLFHWSGFVQVGDWR